VRIRSIVINRLEVMLDRPELWGGPEAYEYQVLTLLEMLYGSERNEWRLAEKWSAFVAKRDPDIGCRPMSGMTSSHVHISNMLRLFRAELDAQAPTPIL
jgi:hypothetical protein